MTATNEELRILLDANVPGQIAKLEESSGQLDRAASYCELLYSQAADKTEAFTTTKKLTLQSLASVAYYINSLSDALFRSIDFEVENLLSKASDARNISQILAIQKEKCARREIGKLTISRNVMRQNKIIYPSMEEKWSRAYQRQPIDYSLLDGIGHGRQSITPQQHSTTLNRSGSIASNKNNDYGIYGIYDYAGRSQTLTRNSVRSMMEHQYRIPQVIPSAINLETVAQQQQIYQNHYQQQQQQQQASYGTCINTNGHQAVLSHGNRNINSNVTNENNNNGGYLTVNGAQTLNYRNPQQSNHCSIQNPTSIRNTQFGGYGNMIFVDSSMNIDHGGAPTTGVYQFPQSTVTSASMAMVNRIRQLPPTIQTHPVNPTMQAQMSYGNVNTQTGPMAQFRLSSDFMGNGLPPPALTNTATDETLHSLAAGDEPLPPPPPAIEINNILMNGGIEMEIIPVNYIEKSRVVYGYEANRPDELNLVEDAIVYILHKNEDGWYEGVMNGKTGLFPGNYVTPI